MVQHIIDFVCSAAPAIPFAVPQIFQTYYDYKIVSALLQSVNVLLLSSYLIIAKVNLVELAKESSCQIAQLKQNPCILPHACW